MRPLPGDTISLYSGLVYPFNADRILRYGYALSFDAKKPIVVPKIYPAGRRPYSVAMTDNPDKIWNSKAANDGRLVLNAGESVIVFAKEAVDLAHSGAEVAYATICRLPQPLEGGLLVTPVVDFLGHDYHECPTLLVQNISNVPIQIQDGDPLAQLVIMIHG